MICCRRRVQREQAVDGAREQAETIVCNLTVVFADLHGFTKLTETRGDLVALTLVERFEHLARQALCGRARLVKRIGDAVMVVAPDPADGVATARKLSTHATMDPDLPAVATGIHHGSAVVSGGDVVGAAVNLASHLSDHAAPGEVLCTEPVAQALQADERVVVRDRGARDVGSLRATSLYELSWPREMVETVTARRSSAPGVGAAGGS